MDERGPGWTHRVEASARQLLDGESSHQTHAALPVSEEGRDVPRERGRERERKREDSGIPRAEKWAGKEERY